MKELSLHILDVVQNSIGAKASLVEISVYEDVKTDSLIIEVEDNGVGMAKEMTKRVMDPFFTTRTTRKVGLGIPLFAQAARNCGGDFTIQSEEGKGTKIKASFVHSHIDRAPMGGIAETIISLVAVNPSVDFVYRHSVGNKQFLFDTRDIKQTLEDVPISNPLVLDWIKKFVEDNLREISGGA
ncbi:MAG: ATP-binding protein [Tepidanaerobacteraceae bacterium]|jgi:hypothetical protein|nr:sensor histidine kinase [Thermoanaerobacterales bacterium]